MGLRFSSTASAPEDMDSVLRQRSQAGDRAVTAMQLLPGAGSSGATARGSLSVARGTTRDSLVTNVKGGRSRTTSLCVGGSHAALASMRGLTLAAGAQAVNSSGRGVGRSTTDASVGTSSWSALDLRELVESSVTDGAGDDDTPLRRAFLASSVPLHLFAFRDIKCPVCYKTVPADDVECHLVMCLTRPRINYNEDVLSEDLGDECAVCLEELKQGDTIARLPCLCIYHKGCIDQWFRVNRSCPEHPIE